jgi:lysophospholipase L1-like esterase
MLYYGPRPMKSRFIFSIILAGLIVISDLGASVEFDKRGALVFAYKGKDERVGLSILAASSSKPLLKTLSLQKNAYSPQVKKDRSGNLWLIWEDWGQNQSRIRLGRLEDGRILSAPALKQPEGFNFCADVCFDQSNEPFVAWTNVRKSNQGVHVQEVSSGKTWLLDSSSSPSTFTPKIIIDRDNKIWVFWTRKGPLQEEIFYRVYDHSEWSSLLKIPTDPRFPALNPDAAMDEEGTIWAVWSAYNGRGYEICSSRRHPGGWSEVGKVSDSTQTGGDLFPSIGFASGNVPVVVCLHSGPKGSSINLRYLRNETGRWEKRIITSIAGLAIPKMIIGGHKIGIAWQSEAEARVVVLDSILERASDFIPFPPPSTQVIANASLLDNEYTCLGDSITYGYNGDTDQEDPSIGYIPRLQNLLVQSFGDTTCFNEGFPGEVTSQGLSRINAVLTAHGSQYFLLMEGTNDIVFNQISMDTSAYNLKEIASRCLGYGVFPALATIIPRRDRRWYNDFYRERIYYLNERIRQVASELAVPLVEQFNAFNDYPQADGGCLSLLSNDLKHPSVKGYQFMALTWFEAIQKFPFRPVDLEVRKRDFVITPPFNPIEISISIQSQGLGNFVFWHDSPKIADKSLIKGYNIYRKKSSEAVAQYQLITTLIPFPQYFDKGIIPSESYVYIVSVVRMDGVEGPCSEPAGDQ